MGLKNLGRVGTHIFLIIFFPQKTWKKFYVSPVNLGRVTGIFFIWPIWKELDWKNCASWKLHPTTPNINSTSVWFPCHLEGVFVTKPQLLQVPIFSSNKTKMNTCTHYAKFKDDQIIFMNITVFDWIFFFSHFLTFSKLNIFEHESFKYSCLCPIFWNVPSKL